MDSYLILTIIVTLLILLFIKARLDAAKAEREAVRDLIEGFGKKGVRHYEEGEYALLSRYYAIKDRSRPGVIDDITWSDLNMDSVLPVIDRTMSQTGGEYLYDLMRSVVSAKEQGERSLPERSRVIRFFLENERERVLCQKAFYAMGKTQDYSVSDCIRFLDDVREEGNGWHFFCLLFGILSISMIFVSPPVGFVLMLLSTAVNVVTYFKRKSEITPYIVCFMFILRAMRESQPLLKEEIPDLKAYQDRLKDALNKLKPLNRNTFLLMSGRRLTGSILELPMDYLRVYFHLDLIKFNRMLKTAKANRPALDDLYCVIGFLDSMISAASFRKSLDYATEPVFVEEEGTVFEVEELFHPLLKEPVPANISAHGGVLVTGSNASGKSTFLKSVALAALLGQTICTVPGKSCRMSHFLIYSSMSLRDDILAGESYYMVEIRSMKRIMDAVRNSSNILCFVDEVLRGTNTVERIAASAHILKSLSGSRSLCFAATHDIELTYMLEDIYENYHFSEEYRNNQISFDYQLLPGRAESRDAIRLLDMIGYDSTLTEAAFATSEEFLETGVWPKL
ncbi:MAG: hypothetical protein K5989_07495 [Lachnospiraceae bacterium]|nr:hypothetical protein [Lachnospiraceae bacterium]